MGELDYNFGESNNVIFQCMTLLTVACCFVNVLCLYLHFPFSDRYYKKYCKCWLECCWKRTLERAAQRKSSNFKPIPCNDHVDIELVDSFSPYVNKEAQRRAVVTRD